jgi:hypothetical protein
MAEPSGVHSGLGRRARVAVGYFAEAVLNAIPERPIRRALIAGWEKQLAKNERLARLLREAA